MTTQVIVGEARFHGAGLGPRPILTRLGRPQAQQEEGREVGKVEITKENMKLHSNRQPEGNSPID